MKTSLLFIFKVLLCSFLKTMPQAGLITTSAQQGKGVLPFKGKGQVNLLNT
jgi:hypothetical protein